MRLSDLDMGQLAMLLKALSTAEIRKVHTDAADLLAGARAVSTNAGEASKLADGLGRRVMVTKLLASDEFRQSLEQADLHPRPADPASTKTELVDSEARPRDATALPSSTPVIQVRTALAGVLMALGEPIDQRTITLAQRALEALARTPTESETDLSSQAPVTGPKVLEAALLSRIALVLLDGKPLGEIVRALLQTILPPPGQQKMASSKQSMSSLSQVSESQEPSSQPRLPAYQPDLQTPKSPELGSIPSRPIIENASGIPGSIETGAASVTPEIAGAPAAAPSSTDRINIDNAGTAVMRQGGAKTGLDSTNGDPSTVYAKPNPRQVKPDTYYPRPQTAQLQPEAPLGKAGDPPNFSPTKPVTQPVDPVYRLVCLLADAKTLDATTAPGEPADHAQALVEGDDVPSQQPRFDEGSNTSTILPSPKTGLSETNNSRMVPPQPPRQTMSVPSSETTSQSTPETLPSTLQAAQPAPEVLRATPDTVRPTSDAPRPGPKVQAEQAHPNRPVDQPARVTPAHEERSGSTIPIGQASTREIANQPVQQLLNQRTDGPIPLFIETTIETMSGPRQVAIVVDQNSRGHADDSLRSVSVHLSLQTDNLGPMAIDLTYGHGLSCVLAVNHSSMDLIQTSLPVLQQSLMDAGLTVLSLSCQRALTMEVASGRATEETSDSGGSPDSSDSTGQMRQIDIRA